MVALGYRKLPFIDAVRVGASEDFADHTISQEAGTGSTDSINFGMTANAPKPPLVQEIQDLGPGQLRPVTGRDAAQMARQLSPPSTLWFRFRWGAVHGLRQ